MRILFWGTPEFAVPTLRALGEEGHDVVGVVTRPDRPAGRGRRLRPSPIKDLARAEGLHVLSPERPHGDAFMETLHELDADLSVVVAYGHILPRGVLDVPRLGSINVHASLLPALRGAAPIHWAIARGHEVSGVTVIRMVEAMDAGPILHRVEVPIGSEETSTELAARLAGVGAQALIEALVLMELGDIDEVEQDHDRATFAPKIGRTGARIEWTLSAAAVANHVRAMDDVPGAWTLSGGQALKLFRPALAPHDGEDSSADLPALPTGAPGTVVDAEGGSGRGLGVATGDGTVWFREAQPAGKRRMESDAWLLGRALEPGTRLE